MRANEINNISIPDFLHSISVYPERKYNGYWMYKSIITPNQRTGSLKVSSSNLWVDYSLGNTGGTLIDLILLIYPDFTVKEVVKRFNSGFFSFQQQTNSIAIKKEENDKYEILAVKSIEHINLKTYLNRRKIHERYWKYLCEVHFKLKDKVYYAVGFTNDSNGYELSWEYWSKVKRTFVRHKMCLLTKDASHIKNGANSVVILESWSDFLSLLTLYPKMESKNDFIIMNSVSTANKLLLILEEMQYENIYVATDNDDAGKKVLEQLFVKFSNSVIALNKFYESCKDVSDFLMKK